MAKNENSNSEPYIVEDVAKNSKFRNWFKSRGAKITAISVGAAVALGAAFTGGVVAAKSVLPDNDGPGFANGFDRDGDHRPPFDGPRPPKPNHAPDGDRQGGFKLDGSTPTTPDSTNNPSTTTP